MEYKIRYYYHYVCDFHHSRGQGVSGGILGWDFSEIVPAEDGLHFLRLLQTDATYFLDVYQNVQRARHAAKLINASHTTKYQQNGSNDPAGECK